MITVAYNYTYCMKQTDRPKVLWYTCEKTDECPLYQKGKCACFNFPLGSFHCPNSSVSSSTGPTKRAKSCDSWIADMKNRIQKTAETEDKKLSKVAGYYFLPMPFLDTIAGKLDGVVNNHFVADDEFDADFIQRVVTFRPRTFFENQVIKDYRDKHVPIFIQQLKEEFPELYFQWSKKYPEEANQFEELSPVGRTVYISSLPDECIIKDKSGTFTKKGDKLICEEYSVTFGSFGARKMYVEIEIKPDMKTVVKEGMDVGNNAVFVD